MNAIDKINKHINLITQIYEAKRIFEDLKINWETDIKKIDLEKLFGGNPVKGLKYLRIDKIKIEPNPNKDELFSTAMESERFLDLIELIKTGTKIIPPVYVDEYIIKDGIKEIKELAWFVDGMHRRRIAACLQLPEIPIMVFERITHYLFTPGKWKFEECPIQEDTSNGYRISGSYIKATSTEGKVITTKPIAFGNPFLDDRNLEYLEISNLDL